MSNTNYYRSEIAEKLLSLDGKQFSLSDYAFYYAIYDGIYNKTLLKTGRQVAKCVAVDTSIHMSDGSFKLAKDIKIGDLVQSYDVEKQELVFNKVVWVSEVQKKLGRKLYTKNAWINAALTHPILMFDFEKGYVWKEVSKLNVNDTITCTKENQIFLNDIQVIDGDNIIDCIDFEVANTHTFIGNGIVCHNSTTLANFMIAESIGTPFFKSFFVAPTQEQTRRFSHTRISKMLTYSPEVRKAFLSDSIDNVFLRMLRNGAEMGFTYASDDADRARGFSADRCLFDEVQDMQFDTVIPVIEECMANSKYAYSIYSGTPKTVENTIETLWQLSSQTEWAIKCDSCSKFTLIMSSKSIGKYGPECINCRKPLNVRNGNWVDLIDNMPIKGFHVPQLILPENVPASWSSQTDKARAQERWNRILYKQSNYGDTQFSNEVLGISSATGTRMLTKPELLDLCRDYSISNTPVREVMKDVTATYMGVDWSGGGAEIKGSEGLFRSRTVMCVWGSTLAGGLKLLYYKVFPNGEHALSFIDEIVATARAYNCQLIIGDAGEGNLANALLKQRFSDEKVQSVRYGSASKIIEWKRDARNYYADRTSLMDNFALALKHKKTVLANTGDMGTFIDDCLNIYEEVTPSGKKVWRHSANQPDDAFHAALFGWVAWKLVTQNMEFYGRV